METDDLRKLAEIEGWVWREATLAWYDGDRPVASETAAGIYTHDGAAWALIEKHKIDVDYESGLWFATVWGPTGGSAPPLAAVNDPDLKTAICLAVVAAHE